MMARPFPKSKSSTDLLAITLIAAAFIFFGAQIPPVFWSDEARVAINSLEMMTSANPLIITYNGEADLWNSKPPLAIWLNALSMRLFGINELALRLPSLVAATATIVVVYLWTRWVSQSRGTAFLAAFILLGTAGYVEIHVARTADFDSLLVLFTTLSAFSFFVAMEYTDKAGKWIYATTAFLTLAIFTKGLAALLMLPGLAIYVLWSRNFRVVARNRATWMGGLTLCAFVALFMASREISEFGFARALWDQDVARFDTAVDGNFFGAWPTYLIGLVWPWPFQLLKPGQEFPFIQSAFPWIFFVPLAALPLANFPSAARTARAAAYLFCCLFGFLIVISLAATKHAWYVAPAYPLIATLAALGFSQLRSVVRWKASLAVGLALAVVCSALNGWRLHRDAAKTAFWLPAFVQSLNLTEPARVRIVYDQKMVTPAVKDGKIVGVEPYYGPIDFYARVSRRRGRDVRIVEPGYIPQRGDIIVGCGTAVRHGFGGLRLIRAQGTCVAYAT